MEENDFLNENEDKFLVVSQEKFYLCLAESAQRAIKQATNIASKHIKSTDKPNKEFLKAAAETKRNAKAVYYNLNNLAFPNSKNMYRKRKSWVIKDPCAHCGIKDIVERRVNRFGEPVLTKEEWEKKNESK